MSNQKKTVAEEIIDKAFRRAKLASLQKFEGNVIEKSKKREIIRINTVYNVVNSELNKLLDFVPKERTLNDFYKELFDIYLEWKIVKRSTERIKFVKKFLKEFYTRYKNSIKICKDLKKLTELRREFYGKVASLLKRNKKHLEVLRQSKIIYEKLPKVKAYPTVVISGLPNVGKSTLLKKLTGSEPEIQPYPFTTKDLMLGYLETPYFTIQFVDTPGVLDKPLDKLNKIERKALLAVKHLSNIVLYVIDVTETCGYSVNQQLNLLVQIRKYFKKSTVIYFSKSDLFSEKDWKKVKELKKKIGLNCFYNHEELKKHIVEIVKNKKEWYL